jgi:putative acetyltransferase
MIMRSERDAVIKPLDPDTPSARRLLQLSDDYLSRLYPPLSNHLASAAELRQPNVAFFGCFMAGTLVGCGVVKVMRDDGVYGEVKRLFIDEGYRSQGLSPKVMARLEQHLLAQDIAVARLEVGVHQPQALGLYAKLGYRARSPFGAYEPDPLSIFMEKTLR